VQITFPGGGKICTIGFFFLKIKKAAKSTAPIIKYFYFSFIKI